ncbi:U-box domain-containing protein 19-like [Senna tora]|uniref:RING-type E3 ubiquitin transferase n=1 Tax=Senna tora TaxID=362788 RepID=A0A834X5R3_9FABA|nr:U-box domain-containing protein 19-like [Senna tora]
MTHNKSNHHHHLHRRILSFPAVFPCEAVSPTTLLTSLISLSRAICSFQSSFFPTQRRNAREAIRQITILLIFLDEIQHRGFPIPPQPFLLCFSEFHLSFQKLLFLLQDLTRRGATLWMLTKSHHVASQFRVVIRGLATALDVLPLRRIDEEDDVVCGEVKELVGLVAEQARRVKFEVDPDDEEAANRVRSVLSQLERGVEPDVVELKRILDYLGVKSWSDCNEEIEFLEEEVGFQCSECDEREVPFLSGLIGLLSYCRGVMFETLDFRDEGKRCNNNTETMMNCINPEDFRCPISLELMTDPVTISTGQTYDRASIQKWLKSGNRVCPKTGEKLTNTELVPNTTLRRLIQQFCADNGVSLVKSQSPSRDIAKTAVAGSPAAAHAIQFLSWFLARRLVFGTNEQRNKAAYEVRLLARSNLFNRSCLVQVGAVSPLVNLLETDERSTQENAIAALLKLSKHNRGKEAIMENRGIAPILKVLKNGKSSESRQIAAAIIFYLSSVKQYRKTIGENPETIPSLVQLIKEGTTCGKKNAIVAIFGLLLHPTNHQRVLEANVVPELVKILSSSEREDLVTDSLAVLAALAEKSKGAEAILKASALGLISRLLQCTTRHEGREHCVSILLSLCVNGGEEVVGALAKEGSVMPSLYSILAEEKCHAGLISYLAIFISPISIFVNIRHKKSVRKFRPDPYLAAIFNCEIWILYCILLPSSQPYHYAMFLPDSFGLTLELIYIAIFYAYAPKDKRKQIAITLVVEVVLVAIIAFIIFLFISFHHRLWWVRVIQSRSIKYMPFFLSLFIFINGLVPLLSALISHHFHEYGDSSLVSILQTLLGLGQLILYACYFRNTKGNDDDQSL